MNHKLKRKWCAALRGQTYHQGTGTLREVLGLEATTHCVLGVLAEVAGIEIGDEDEHLAYKGLYKIIPESVADRLIIMNDRIRITFPELADYIEKEIC
jgi:hypothetical protein